MFLLDYGDVESAQIGTSVELGLGWGLGAQCRAGQSPKHTQFSLLQPTEQFNGQGASFNGGSISYSQPGLSGVRGLAGVDGLGGSQGGHVERGHPGRKRYRCPT